MQEGEEIEPEETSDDDEVSDSDEFLRAIAHAPEAAAPISEREPLAQVGPFKILEKIGRGGMGIVYRAEDAKLKRIVALKVLPQDFDEDGHRRRRFMREARLAASIAHPNVATIHEVGEADNRIYIAMELVRGKTLRARGKVSIEDALRIVKDIARGVAKAHAAGIAHRDLKPDNVMISDEGEVKVLDFGLAKPTDESKDQDPEQVTVTQEGRIVGTPGYMSPEQATGRSVDVRTDVFSLGVILYEMLTGTRPFKGQTSMDQLIATSRDDYTPPSEIDESVPPAIETIIDRCLKKEPGERFANATELLLALDAAATAPATKERSRSPWIAALAIGAVALGVARLVFGGGATATTTTPAIASTLPVVAPPASTAPIAKAPETPATTASAPAPAASTAPPVVAVKAQPAPPIPARTAPTAMTSATMAPPGTAAPPPSAPGGVIEKSPY